jgi:NADH:ubiquinone oxidoreductase subunit 3 (subunit A)
MNTLLYTPPVAFAVLLAFFWLLSLVFSKLAFHKPHKADGTTKSYACGEDIDDHSAQPDYSQFFIFAFYFTMAHVATMMLTTIPVESLHTLVLGLIYVIGIIAGFCVVLRK